MDIEDLKRRAGITEADDEAERYKRVTGRAGGGLSHWDVHPNYPLEEWQYEVANDDTRLGYWEWVKAGLINDGNPEGATIQIPTTGQ